MSYCDALGFLPLEKALEMLQQAASNKKPDVESISIEEALNRILAENIGSPCNIPNYDNSAMDGYALNANTQPADNTFNVVGKSFAGAAFEGSVGLGECIRIMTGAKVPADCNCVVMQENTIAKGDSITLTKPVRVGDNIRPIGNDIQKGALMLRQGKRLSPIDIGVLATLGVSTINVYRKLRVGLFSTGDEITPLGEPLKEGFIYDSNRYLLHAALQRLDVEIENFGVLPDNPDIIEATFIQAANTCDAVMSSGGVSVGDADFTRDILHKLGDITFYKLAMKPGKPFAFGTITSPTNDVKTSKFFGLPGNPVSAAVTFHQLALPALRHMSGEIFSAPVSLQLPCDSALRKNPGRVDFQRAKLKTNSDGTLSVTTTGTQSSGALSSLGAADCYIKLEQERGNVAVGEQVEVIPFDHFLQ